MVRRVTIQVNGVQMHLVLGKTVQEWEDTWGGEDELWDIDFEELIDGTLFINPTNWYWYIDGRCYETYEDVIGE